MPRSVPEWIGTTPDTAIPARVKMRVFDRANERCQQCDWPIHSGYEWHADHIVALINGGENREINLQVLCHHCHSVKTRTDVSEKATTARKRKKHLGIKAKPKRPLMGTKASGWRKRMDGKVERWDDK